MCTTILFSFNFIFESISAQNQKMKMKRTEISKMKRVKISAIDSELHDHFFSFRFIIQSEIFQKRYEKRKTLYDTAI